MSGGTQHDFNPFLGPVPYRKADSHLFIGRESVAEELIQHVLTWPCLTLYGPSGAGKSSLMQARVIPRLEDEHRFSAASVEGWPGSLHPLDVLVGALHKHLELGPQPVLTGKEGEAQDELKKKRHEALDEALKRAEQRSDRPVLLLLDQFEQMLMPGRRPAEIRELLEALERLMRNRQRRLHLVLSLREDYLGRFRDRARGRRELLAQGFRLGPMTVREMTAVVCGLAERGQPPRKWPHEEVRKLMRQVREKGQDELDEAEVQAAFGQIVCRALWEEQMSGNWTPVDAEPLVHRYLEKVLKDLGPLESKVWPLLEEHLVAADESRALLTEAQAHEVLKEDAGRVLEQLEAAAVLRAEEHQGSRYFELGHDWLARKVFTLRRERRELATRRRLIVTTVGALVVATAVVVMGFWIWQQREAARKATERAVQEAERARNFSLLAGARELKERSQPEMAAKLLLEVNKPEHLREWDALTYSILVPGIPETTLASDGPVRSAAFSPDGARVVTASSDGTARVWRSDGQGEPVVLQGHRDWVRSAAFSPDGARVVTASGDGRRGCGARTARASPWCSRGTGLLCGPQPSARTVRGW